MYGLYFNDKLSCVSNSKKKLEKPGDEIVLKYNQYDKAYHRWLINYCEGDEPVKPTYPISFNDVNFFLRSAAYEVREVISV